MSELLKMTNGKSQCSVSFYVMQSLVTSTGLLEGAEVNKISRTNEGGLKEILSIIAVRV